jgi:hypothetical protein
VKLTRRSSLSQVAAAVSYALRHAGISAVLTGGACATLHSDGAYQSHDLDFILQGRSGSRRTLDDAMASIGFERKNDRYVHPATPYFVEFPRGPLAIGDDFDIKPVKLELDTGSTTALSPTDACRDRLAAFYHWSDRQSLEVAVAIARRRQVNLAAIRRWSQREGFLEKFDEFRAELARTRRTR